VTAEFNWWLLIVGVVAGAGLAWLVLADSARREREIAAEEIPAEAEWIARLLAEEGIPVDAATAEAVLLAHRRYLAAPPPDALVDPVELERAELERAELEPSELEPSPAGSAAAAAHPGTDGAATDGGDGIAGDGTAAEPAASPPGPALPASPDGPGGTDGTDGTDEARPPA
jgi:hypothetical protein